MNKQLLAQAIQTKRAATPPHWDTINCTKDGLDTEGGKGKLEAIQAEVIKAHPLQEVSFICLLRHPSE